MAFSSRRRPSSASSSQSALAGDAGDPCMNSLMRGRARVRSALPKSGRSARCGGYGATRRQPRPCPDARAIGGEKCVALLRRKVADRKNRRQMLRRDRRRIGRVGDLRDEAAILAQRLGQPLPRARWALVDHGGQDAFVGADAASRRRGSGDGLAMSTPRRRRSPPWRSQAGRRDRDVAQAGPQQDRHGGRIAAGIAAEADRNAGSRAECATFAISRSTAGMETELQRRDRRRRRAQRL